MLTFWNYHSHWNSETLPFGHKICTLRTFIRQQSLRSVFLMVRLCKYRCSVHSRFKIEWENKQLSKRFDYLNKKIKKARRNFSKRAASNCMWRNLFSLNKGNYFREINMTIVEYKCRELYYLYLIREKLEK